MPSTQTLLYIVTGALVLFVVFTIFHAPLARGIGIGKKPKPPAPRFTDEHFAKIEARLALKPDRSRDLALLHVLHETGIAASQVGRVRYSQPGVITLDGKPLGISDRAIACVTRWTSENALNGGDIVFTRHNSGKPMPRAQVEELVRKWRSRLTEIPIATPADASHQASELAPASQK